MNYKGVTASELLIASEARLENEVELSELLNRAADLASEFDSCLSLLIRVLANEASEIAAEYSDELAVLGELDTDGPILAEAASKALAQFKDT